MSNTTTYEEFLSSKAQRGAGSGFKPHWMPSFLFDFQVAATEWNCEMGRSATFADCGMGKTPMEHVWAENVVRHTNKPVLELTPLAVASQAIREADKFCIDAVRSNDGKTKGARIHVTNYEKLHHFNPDDFGGVVCDESSAIKAFDGKRRAAVTEFLRTIPYRLLCTATAAPNDYIELGTSSEALGVWTCSTASSRTTTTPPISARTGEDSRRRGNYISSTGDSRDMLSFHSGDGSADGRAPAGSRPTSARSPTVDLNCQN